MTHLLIGPAGSTAQQAQQAAAAQQAAGGGGKAGRGGGRGRTRSHAAAGEDHSVPSVRGASPCSTTTAGSSTPQWTQQQEAIALAMQAVLSALTSHFPVDSVSRAGCCYGLMRWPRAAACAQLKPRAA